MAKAELPTRHFASQRAFEKWLSVQPADAAGIWLKLPKKACEERSVTKSEAIEAALMHGWIDGQIGALDAQWFVTRFTPRTARSKWSKINRATAERLISERRIAAGGLAEVKRAKADGRWEAAYASQRMAIVPPDLQKAINANTEAKAFFADLDRANRYALIYRVEDAKKPETRTARIAKFVAMLARGERIHEPRSRALTIESGLAAHGGASRTPSATTSEQSPMAKKAKKAAKKAAPKKAKKK